MGCSETAYRKAAFASTQKWLIPHLFGTELAENHVWVFAFPEGTRKKGEL